MTTVTIDMDYPGGTPRRHREVLVALVHGGAGGAAGGRVIGDTQSVRLDDAGHATIDLGPNEAITPAGTFYRISIPGSSPSLVRHITAPAPTFIEGDDGPVEVPRSWADPLIQVETPVPPGFVPLVGPPGVVDATGIATYDAPTQTVDVPMPTASDVGAAPVGAMAGVRVPARGLSGWRTTPDPLRHLVVLGDSIVDGSIGTGGGSDLVTAVRRVLARETAETIHPGLQPIWRTTAAAPWIGAWSLSGGAAAVDGFLDAVTGRPISTVGPYGPALIGAPNMVQLTTETSLATWTRPAAMAVERVVLCYIDSTTSSGDLPGGSYSVDGGSSWSALPMGYPDQPEIRRHPVDVTDPADVRIRSKTAGGAAGYVFGALGLEAYGPSPDAGVAIHNVGRGSHGWLNITSAGDPRPSWASWIDLIAPHLTIGTYSNDVAGDQAAAEAAVTEITSHLAAVGDLILVEPTAQVGRETAWVEWRREMLHDLAATLDVAHIDIPARWGTAAEAQAAGLLSADGLHPLPAGGRDMAAIIHRLLRAA